MKRIRVTFWHVSLVAIVIGIALAWLHAGSMRYGDGEWRPGVDRAQFESLLRMTKLPHAQGIFKDLTIYPTIDNKTYVCGEFLINLSDPTHYRKFEFFATNPLDVRSFLAAKYPQVSYTYAWWEDVRLQRAFWFAMPLCLLGALFPAIRRAFAAKALPAAEETAKFGQPVTQTFTAPEPEAPQIAPEPQPDSGTPVVVLSSEPLAVVPASSDEEDKSFEGEYYPVARNVTPRHES